MVLKLFVAVTLVCVVASVTMADTVRVGFNDDSFQLGYERPLVRDDYGNIVGNLGFIYNDDKSTKLGHVGLDFVGNPGQYPGLEFGIGTRLVAGSTSRSTDFINLGIGARGAYVPPQLNGIGFAASVYHAPQIFSFRDSDRLTQADVMVTYAIIPKVQLSLGYYNTRLKDDRDNQNQTIDSGLRIGFNGSF